MNQIDEYNPELLPKKRMERGFYNHITGEWQEPEGENPEENDEPSEDNLEQKRREELTHQEEIAEYGKEEVLEREQTYLHLHNSIDEADQLGVSRRNISEFSSESTIKVNGSELIRTLDTETGLSRIKMKLELNGQTLPVEVVDTTVYVAGTAVEPRQGELLMREINRDIDEAIRAKGLKDQIKDLLSQQESPENMEELARFLDSNDNDSLTDLDRIERILAKVQAGNLTAKQVVEEFDGEDTSDAPEFSPESPSFSSPDQQALSEIYTSAN